MLVKPMMNIALTSDFPSTATQEIFDLLKNRHPNPRIAWIPPFTRGGREHFPVAQRIFAANGLTNLEYCDIDEDPNATQLAELAYDIIYLTGGDPIGFRHNIQRTGLSARLLQRLAAGCPFVAASGGSMQLTKNVSLFRLLGASLEDVIATRSAYEALGVVAYEILPHLNRLEPSFLELVRRYSERVGHDVIALSDGAALLYANSDSYKCLGRVVRFHNGVETEIGETT
jgi:peptidase E